MIETFLVNFMTAVHQITRAERCMVVDTNLQLLESINLDQETIESEEFGSFARNCLQQALEHNQSVITNNVVTDQSAPPTTNTNFSNLRVVIAIPVSGLGAVYLDQHIRGGIIAKPMVDKLQQLAVYILDQRQQESSVNDMVELYHQI